MARMSEKDAQKNIVRFSDPRLRRVGFGISLEIFNPKERTVLIYRKGSNAGIDPGLSVIPFDELQPLKLTEFCILGNRIMEKVRSLGHKDGHYFRILGDELEGLCGDQIWNWDAIWHSVSVYYAVGEMNKTIEYLQLHIPQKKVEELVWPDFI